MKTSGRITTIRYANFRGTRRLNYRKLLSIDRRTRFRVGSSLRVEKNGIERRHIFFFFFFGKRGNVTGQGSGTNFPTANRYFNKRMSAAHYR